jgi:hypothetical protein
MPEDLKVKWVTDSEIVTFIIWNIKVMESGIFPSTDHLGRPLTGHRATMAGKPLAVGWRATLTSTLSDLKEKVKVHRYPRNYMCIFFCERCLSHRHMSDTGNGYYFADDALWMQMIVSHEQYVLTTPPGYHSPWLAFPSWTIDRHRDDLLHMLYLGVVKDVAGQVLFDLATVGGTRDMDNTLKLLWLETVST